MESMHTLTAIRVFLHVDGDVWLLSGLCMAGEAVRMRRVAARKSLRPRGRETLRQQHVVQLLQRKGVDCSKNSAQSVCLYVYVQLVHCVLRCIRVHFMPIKPAEAAGNCPKTGRSCSHLETGGGNFGVAWAMNAT